ncbi:MAG: tail fiber domain-containing protein [candidate division Zixibacteria bacterium]|nr:tail fiber domain-containing protein [candidate division Zixibacteria bacterium]
MRLVKCIFVLGLFLLGVAQTAESSYPPFMNYQGRLTDPSGNPVPDGNYNVVFTIYDLPTGGTELWTSGTLPVSVKDGLFNVVLGEIGSSVFDPAGERFLGIKVGSDPEITPRTYLTTVPYTYYAGKSGTVELCPVWDVSGDNAIRTEGNVGIGTTNPQARLVVGDNIKSYSGACVTVGDTSVSGISRVVLGEDAYNYCGMVWSNLSDGFSVITSVGGDTKIGIQVNDGKVGIGTSYPDFKLHVKSEGEGDGMRVDNGAGTPLFRVRENSDASCEIQIYDNASTVKAMIRGNADSYFNGGDVGIGTTSPNYTLDVRGTIGNNTTLYHSDQRWKKNIAPLDNALGSVRQLRGVSYEWRQDEFSDMNFPGGRQLGFIAQEVEAVVPEVVHTAEDGYKSIDYAKLIALLTEAVKTQQAQIDNLNARIAELEK